MLGDLPIVDLDFVALDLEATGVAHGFDRIVEIGAARFRVDRDGVVVPGPVFNRLVQPDMAIPEVVSRLTGIDNAMVAEAPRLDAVWGDFRTFLRGEDSALTVVVAHSAHSDLAYLTTEAVRLGLPAVDHPFVCTFEIARRVFPKARRYSLSALITHLAAMPDPDGAFHRAVADALHTRNLFARCVAAVAGCTLGALGVVQAQAVPDVADFGVSVPARLAKLGPAIGAQKPVRIMYRGGSKGRRWRPVTPLAFFARQGTPMLRAWCHLDDAAKTFRCDRISRVEIAVDTFGA